MNRREAFLKSLSLKRMAELMAAFGQDEAIQVRNGDGRWSDCSDTDVSFELPESNYRVKPQPDVVYIDGNGEMCSADSHGARRYIEADFDPFK